MAIIIDFQEYINSRPKKENEIKRNNISTENDKIIYFNKEVAEK